MALRKPTDPIRDPMGDLPQWLDQEFAQEYPDLHAFLLDTTYEDGKPRLPGTMAISVKGGVLAIALNDNDNNRTAWINMGTWAEGIFMANQAICSAETDWKARKTTFGGQKPPF